MNALVYDIEIIKAIPSFEPMIEGIEYCEGWCDYANMGISIICAYDYVEERYRVFCKDNFDLFYTLTQNRELLIGFNNVGFDNKVLRLTNNRCYDILREIWISLGLDPNVFAYHTHGGYSLNEMCKINNIGTKTGHGASAPILWQRGEIGAVIDYCLNDVKLTKDLFELSQKGPIKSPKGGTLTLCTI